jgi:hypothetical protein
VGLVLDTERISSDGEYRNEIRHRCFTDHFFLAQLVGFDKFNERIHRPVVNLYFPKNPNLSIEQQHHKKYRLHLDPRGTFKTTIGRVDSLQWVLAFPADITILNETATQPLAKAISIGISKFFWRRPEAGLTPLQLAFPELVWESRKEPEGEWDTPLHVCSNDIDHTLSFTSPLTSQSGWHPYLECIDDMVDTKNSGIHASDESRLAVNDTYYTNKNTLRHGGYINLRGTRYHPFDLYGDALDKMDPELWEVLIRSAVTVKSGVRMLPGEFPGEEDLILNFPELPDMDYRHLRAKFYDNYESFMCQQQNDPQGGSVPLFDNALFNSIAIPADKVPGIGDTFICWRLPYNGKDYMANRAEGAAARIWDGRVYILDAWDGIYTPSRLAQKIVRECQRHQTGMLVLEAFPGSQYIEAHIRNEAVIRNFSLKIQWLGFQEDDNERIERMRQLEPQARAGRLLISSAVTKAAELRKQFLNFGIIPENGIVDSISRLADKVPISLLRAEIADEEVELRRQRRDEMISHFVYGYGDGVSAVDERRQKEEASAKAMQAVSDWTLPDILGGLDG